MQYAFCVLCAAANAHWEARLVDLTSDTPCAHPPIPVTRVSNGQGGWAATVGRFDTLYSVHRILKHVGDPINVKAF